MEKIKLSKTENERFYALQIENKEGKGFLKRHSNRSVVLTIDEDGTLISYDFEAPLQEVIVPQEELAQNKIVWKESRMYTSAQIEQILKMFWSGVPLKEIAVRLNITYSTLVSYIGRYKIKEGVRLDKVQVASVIKMMETCSEVNPIAKVLRLPVCLVREVKRDWAYVKGEEFGLNKEQVQFVLKKSSIYTDIEMKKRGYIMYTLAKQIGLSVDELAAFLKLAR